MTAASGLYLPTKLRNVGQKMKTFGKHLKTVLFLFREAAAYL